MWTTSYGRLFYTIITITLVIRLGFFSATQKKLYLSFFFLEFCEAIIWCRVALFMFAPLFLFANKSYAGQVFCFYWCCRLFDKDAPPTLWIKKYAAASLDAPLFSLCHSYAVVLLCYGVEHLCILSICERAEWSATTTYIATYLSLHWSYWLWRSGLQAASNCTFALFVRK